MSNQSASVLVGSIQKFSGDTDDGVFKGLSVIM